MTSARPDVSRLNRQRFILFRLLNFVFCITFVEEITANQSGYVILLVQAMSVLFFFQVIPLLVGFSGGQIQLIDPAR